MTEPVSPDAVASAAAAVLTGPKRQHFLPKFYLEGFCRDGLLAVYDREMNTVRLQQPVNTAVIGHFYTMQDEQGRKRFELEQLLSEYEGKAKPVVDLLAAKQEIDADQRADLAIFVALGAMRTPDVIESLKKMNSGLVEKILRSTYSSVDAVAEQLRQDGVHAGMSDDELKAEARLMVDIAHREGVVKTNEKWAVGMAMKMALDVAPILAGRDWVVLHRDHDSKSFITTDAPVLLTTVAPRAPSIWGVGFGSADALIIFPLTQSCVLMMFGDAGDFRHATADRDQVRRINLALAERCMRFVVGRDEKLVESLAAQARLAQTNWRPKMQLQ